MPTKILVQFRGIIQGEHVVTDDVIRIGGDANCEICVPGQSAHLLTIRFDGGRFTVFNRSGRELRLESRKFEANSSMPWQNGEDLFLDGDLVLTLVVDGAPEPVRQRATVVVPYTENLQVDEPDVAVNSPIDDLTDETPQAPASNTLSQVAVIFVCLLIFGSLMFIDQGSQSNASPRDAATVKREFAERISEIQIEIDKNPVSASDLESIRVALQDARIHELRRGQEAKAIKLYRKLLQDLSDQYRKTDRGDFRDDPVGRIAKMVFAFSVKQSADLESKARLAGS